MHTITDGSSSKVPTWYYVAAGIALLWNAFGVMAYLMQVTATPEELAASYSAEQVKLLLAVPAWATSATAIATNVGLLGCLLLLLRKSTAKLAFIISLIAIIVQDIYLFLLSDWASQFGNAPILLQALVFVVGAALVWFSHSVADRYYR